MVAKMALVKPISKFNSPIPRTGSSRNPSSPIRFFAIKMSSSGVGSKKKSQKQEIKETLLTPRFYTTDFDEMEQLFNTQINKNLNMAEFEALLTDFNQTHFVRNKEFKEAAEKIDGPSRQIAKGTSASIIRNLAARRRPLPRPK